MSLSQLFFRFHCKPPRRQCHVMQGNERARLLVTGSEAGKSAGKARCSERRTLRGRRAYLASPPSPSSPSPSSRASISVVSAATTPRSAAA